MVPYGRVRNSQKLQIQVTLLFAGGGESGAGRAEEGEGGGVPYPMDIDGSILDYVDEEQRRRRVWGRGKVLRTRTWKVRVRRMRCS